MNRIFKHTYEIRYDECDTFGNLTPAYALRYFQDIAGRDSAELGLQQKHNWIARRTVVEFNKPVTARTQLQINTYSMGFTKVTAQRGYDLWLVEGDDTRPPDIHARTMWVFFDERNKPARIPAEAHAFWHSDGALMQQEEAAWPVWPETAPAINLFPLRFSHLDTLSHMNNAAYVEVLDDAAWVAMEAFDITPATAPGSLIPLSYDIDYLESAVAGDLLQVECWFEPEPHTAGEFSRLERIMRGNTILIRARSRWRWQQKEREI